MSIPIARWAAWTADAGEGDSRAGPDVRFVDAMLRRRLSRLARMTLHVAHACIQELPRVRVVFASRHGELNPTMGMLRALAREEPLSPATFSLSVHNAASGLLSILREDPSASTAIAAGAETLGYALLESYCQFENDPDSPVLMVYGDEPLPAEYRGFADRPEQPHALAVLLARDAERCVRIAVEPGAGDPSPECQASAFARHLACHGAGRWRGKRHAWTWQ